MSSAVPRVPTIYEWGGSEWGSRLAGHNSPAGAMVAAHAPVARWAWGVAPPYEG